MICGYGSRGMVTSQQAWPPTQARSMMACQEVFQLTHQQIGFGGTQTNKIGVRILCSKIRELCYALMLTIYANYTPQISHYAQEIYHYASKQNNFFRSQKHIFPQNSYKTHRKVTKLKNRSKVSPISHAYCTAESKMPQCSTILTLQPGSLRSAIFFPSSHVETAHAQYARATK